MTLVESVKSVLNKFATFSGRASRSEYWWWQLACFIVGFIETFISTLLGRDGSAFSLILQLLQLAILLPSLAVAVRRIHDSNHSGWWVICPIVNLVLMFLPSTPGENDYGSI